MSGVTPLCTEDDRNKAFTRCDTWAVVLANFHLLSIQKELDIFTDVGSGAAVVPGRLFTVMSNATYLPFSAMHITMPGHL